MPENFINGSWVAAREGGRGVPVDVLAGVQRQQPQQPLPVGGQPLVGQVEGDLHAGDHIGRVLAADDRPGVAVDHPVEDLARLVVILVPRGDHLPLDYGVELFGTFFIVGGFPASGFEDDLTEAAERAGESVEFPPVSVMQ